MSRYVYFWGRRVRGRVSPASPVFSTQGASDQWGDRFSAERKGLIPCRLPDRTPARENPPRKRGRVSFHGMFTRRADALARKRKVPGSRIETRTVRGVRRFIVMQQLDEAKRKRGRARVNPEGAEPEKYPFQGETLWYRPDIEMWFYSLLDARHGTDAFDTPGKAHLALLGYNPPKRKRNPKGETEIYAHLREIVATKGPGHLNCDAACRRARHTYRHVFTSGPPVLGKPDGSLEIPA